MKDYVTEIEKTTFLNAVVQGLMDVEEGRTVSLADARKRLGIDRAIAAGYQPQKAVWLTPVGHLGRMGHLGRRIP